MLELSMAENQKLQVAYQLGLLRTDYKSVLNHFNMLLNSENVYQPLKDTAIYTPALANKTDIADNPDLQYQEQQIQLSRQQHQLEKNKLMPSLNLGYRTATIIGWQTNQAGAEQFYGAGDRFNSINVGVGIPLFFGEQKSRIKAANIKITQQQQQLESVRQQLNTALQEARNSYNQYNSLIKSYQKEMLPNANQIINTSTNKLNAGEIDYLNWAVLVNQAIQIRSEYFDIVAQINEAAFEIERINAIN